MSTICKAPWKSWTLPRTRGNRRLEGAEQALGGVPQTGVDGAGAVAQLELQIEIAVAVGPQLLVADQVDLVDGLAVAEFFEEAPLGGSHCVRPSSGEGLFGRAPTACHHLAILALPVKAGPVSADN